MLLNHLKLALRVLARRPFFTFASLFGIALTLVVLISVSAMLDHVLAPGGAEPRLGRTLFVDYVAMEGKRMASSGGAGYALLERTARDLPGVERVSFHTEARDVISYVEGRKVASQLRNVDPDYWRILGFRFLEGGPTTEAHEAAAEPVAVISAATRNRYFGPGAAALGRTLEADGIRYRVCGVVQNVSRTRLSAGGDIWTTLAMLKGDDWRTRFRGPFEAMLLAHDSGRFPVIRAEFRARIARLEVPDPEYFETIRSEAGTRLEQIVRELTSSRNRIPVTETVLIFACVVLAFMLLPAVNLVNLTVSRIIERSSEIGVRKAFGASSHQLVGQFLLENCLLALLGGIIGIVLSIPVMALWNRLSLFGDVSLAMNPRIALYGLGLSLVFGVMSGLYPALRMSRLDAVLALKGGTR